jgi:hypothetical protein
MRFRTTLSDDAIAIGYSFTDCACAGEVMSMTDFRNIIGKFRGT